MALSAEDTSASSAPAEDLATREADAQPAREVQIFCRIAQRLGVSARALGPAHL
jgi:hypothetical protein